MIGGLGLPELVVIFGIALLLFGAGKIPEIARSLGKGIKEFKKAGKDILEVDEEINKSTTIEKK